MALFKDTTEKKEEKAMTEVSSSKKKGSVKQSSFAGRILSRPRVTEKAYALNALNQYVFVITKESTKNSVKRAVEEVYGVNVEKVHIVRLPAQKRIFGKNIGTKTAIKKAIVSVKKGQTIELFKGGM